MQKTSATWLFLAPATVAQFTSQFNDTHYVYDTFVIVVPLYIIIIRGGTD